jgi:hypothetical protein
MATVNVNGDLPPSIGFCIDLLLGSKYDEVAVKQFGSAIVDDFSQL